MKKETKMSLKRLEDLRIAECRRIDEKMEMSNVFLEKMQASEAARLDAIRSVDMNAVTVANEKTVAQAAVLATQLVETTNSLRNLITESLEKQSKMIEATNTITNEKIDKLDKVQTSTGGKSSVTMPLLMLVSSLMGGLVMFIIQNLMK
jgi:hypothetical protein